ncbi:hypothetical protein [Magnetospirillum moscoviense]|uniref:Outer membrane protein beta-barrel domain-containing protein n=1 Tax=Magnetospirillum moscoviense TaxID=1437059 RepID=A0A178N0M2_9PROT|nr:hypothetical protein [Magnetospirillum moscoviense]OAN60915.1 hypothetical protein A6A05_06815 [Magnetospirillum moscoviense]
MRRLFQALIAALIALTAAGPAIAQDDIGTNANPSVAAKGGWWEIDNSGTNGRPAFGAEFAIDNLGFAPTYGKLHHMFSWNHSDQDGLELNSAEWNVHWMVEARPNLWIGLGPGLGWVWADGKNLDDTLGLQLGGSAHSYVGNAIFGIETRYQWTEADSLDNWLTMVSVGYRF